MLTNQSRKRKHHVLTFIGALIVFFIFVFKEGLGEHWNHHVESIDTAAQLPSAPPLPQSKPVISLASGGSI